MASSRSESLKEAQTVLIPSPKKANRIYRKAIRNGVYLECTCVGISVYECEELMEVATRADKKKVDRILIENGCLEMQDLKFSNPYHYYKTENHLIGVWSGIEHFYRINKDSFYSD